ncbi:hypothetical protein ACJJIF_11990 [Microbulbifer sp. SSSA002]|uniref:hypothetical protein n=1 Tax=Microbulbifer sp. SSSA002 TaxID=3243376 RepID=UPI00403A3EF1
MSSYLLLSICTYTIGEERKGISCPPLPTDYVGEAEPEVEAQLHILRALLFEETSWCVLYPERISWSEGYKDFAKSGEQVWEIKVGKDNFKLVKHVYFNPNTKKVLVRE